MSKNLKGSLMLLVATVIWGSAFVAQELADGYIKPFTLNCFRSLVAVVMLVPVAYIFKTGREKKTGVKEKLYTKKTVLAGVLCGLALSVAANLQQFGISLNATIRDGSSDKAGFLTAMYIIFVPIFSCFVGKKLRFSMVAAVIISVFGLYFISVTGGLTMSLGDVFLLLCAVSFALHIMTVDRFVDSVDGIALSSVQFLTVGVVSGVLMLVYEHDCLTLYNIAHAALPVLFCGIMSSGIAYTLQILGQKNCEPTIASLIMSLESLFCLVTASIYNQSMPTNRMLVGCGLMMVAIFVVETPFTDRLVSRLFGKKTQHDRV